MNTLDVILFEPEIPPNTGNIIRLCANTGARLHLIEPLGFALGDRELKRAGLDYHEYASVSVHQNLAACLATLPGKTLYAFSTRGLNALGETRFDNNAALLFGPETRGLPQPVLDELPPAQRVRLPMRPDSRSLNLSNAVAIGVYECWRQQGFPGAG